MIKRTEAFGAYRSTDALNGSLLAHQLPPGSPRLLAHIREHDIQPQTDTRVGTALHSIVEFLPEDKFREHFVVMPDFRKDELNVKADGTQSSSRTKWVREQETNFAKYAVDAGQQVLTQQQFSRVLAMLQAISAHPRAMDLIINSDRELSAYEEIEGVECKGRVDGLTEDHETQWNLKTSKRGCAPWDFARTASQLHYLFKDAFHSLLLSRHRIEPKQFCYLVVTDPTIPETGFNAGKQLRPVECCVVSVPMDVIWTMQDEVRRQIQLYRECEESGVWWGQEDYDLIIFDRDMPEVQLVD